MPTRSRGIDVVLGICLALTTGCSASLLQSRDIELERGDQFYRVADDSGAIIVGKREVGAVVGRGHGAEKITNSRGQPLAFVYPDYIQLRGGANVPLKIDADGAMYLPVAATRAAGLTPIDSRVRPDGHVATTPGAVGIASKGTSTPRGRRLLLAVMLLTANNMW